MTWPSPASILAELRERDASKRARYGNAPLSQWPVQAQQERPPRPVKLHVASEREMALHARKLARILEAKALSRVR